MDADIQESIDKAVNLNRIKTSIEVLRELEMYKNTNPIYIDGENSVSTYMMYKDLHAVERILLNQYGDDLGKIYWRLYKYISNTIQPFLFDNIFSLRVLERMVEKIDVLEPSSQYSNLRWLYYNNINYIEKRVEILSSFKTMLDWVDDKINKGMKPYEREAYNSGFLKK